MAVAINIDPPFVSGADETQAFYIFTDQACTTALDISGRTYRMDIAIATTLAKVKTLLVAALDTGTI